MIVRAVTIAALLAIASVVLVASCAPQRPAAYNNALAAGDRAWSAGRLRDAAEAYDRAAAATTRGIDRDEATYRAARAWMRVGETSTALTRFDWLNAHGDRQSRQARGTLEAARIRMASGDPNQIARAEHDLEQLARDDPDLGPTRRGIDIILTSRDARDPTGALALTWIDGIYPALARTQLAPALLMARATRLAQLRRIPAAIETYERLLAMPYPHNMHWDDGGLAYARLLRAEHRPSDALQVIERVLSTREVRVLLPGEYERPHFGELQWLRAEIERDDMHQPDRAADTFHTLYTSFRDSLLRDNALYEEAQIRTALGQTQRACNAWVRLAREFPCTRFGRTGRSEAGRCGTVVTTRDAGCGSPQP